MRRWIGGVRIERAWNIVPSPTLLIRPNRLAIASDKSHENKENIPPIFNYLGTSSPNPTVVRPVSPPPNSATKSRLQSHAPEDKSTQPLSTYQNRGVQTDPVPSPEEYQELRASYDALHTELDQYKKAHNALADKYAKNKRIWMHWLEQENTRRGTTRKRKLGDGAAIEEGDGGRRIHGYTTPATSITGGSPISRPPDVSPIKQQFRPSVIHTSPKRKGLFAGLIGSSTADPGDNGGLSGFNIPKAGLEEPPSSPLSSLDAAPVLSTPETQAPLNPFKTTQFPRDSHKSPHDAGPQEDNADSTESDNEPRLGALSSNESTGPAPPPRNPPRTPKIKEEAETYVHAREGDSSSRPVVIKSESHLSSEGFGYHIYDQESLDLDDIGQKPETPRKRQKTYQPQPELVESADRPGWIAGGFRISPISGEEAQDDLEAEEEPQVPTLPSLILNKGELAGIRTDSQLSHLGMPEDVKVEPRSSPPLFTEYKNRPISPPRRSNRLNTVQKVPLSSAEAARPSKRSPIRPRAPKRRPVSAGAIASLTEDGTDGCYNVNPISTRSPALTEEQGKLPERDTWGTSLLDEILNSPPPKTPNLEHLKKSVLSRSSPTKKRVRGGDGFDGPQMQPPSMVNPTTSHSAKGATKQTKRMPRDASMLDISDFKVNPEVNDGRDYAFAETVRNREARKCLPGCVKACCRDLVGFTKAAGLPVVNRGPRWRSSSPAPIEDDEVQQRGSGNEAVEKEDIAKEFTNRYGRHRDAFGRMETPPGFWNSHFPSTQELGEQRQQAEEMRRKKVEGMRKEAEKGPKARIVYRR